ncbi:alkylation response protein AidB-like acyl-CoA dehydrogenase [Bradyrhizobium sp. LM3.6]
MVSSIAKGPVGHSEPDYIARAEALAGAFAARAAEHDRTGSFPFENFRELSDAGLLSLTVPGRPWRGRSGRTICRTRPRHHRQG